MSLTDKLRTSIPTYYYLQYLLLHFLLLLLRLLLLLLLLLQSALQPLLFMACSTIFEYSQEGFYRVPLPAARQTPKLEDPPPGVPHVWNDVSEPQQRNVELWARNFREFCRKLRLSRHFWVLLHAVNLRHGTDGFTSPPKEGALRNFSPEKSTASAGFEPANLGTKDQHAHLQTTEAATYSTYHTKISYDDIPDGR